MSDLHKFRLHIEDGASWLEVECPYDRADENRPCWTYGLDGKRDPALQEDCNYQEWIGNLSIEDVLHGSVFFELPSATVVWVGDSMEVHLP